MLDPLPRRYHRVLAPVSSTVSSAFPNGKWVGFPHLSRLKRLRAGGGFRGRRYFVMFRPPSLLAPQIVPTAANSAGTRHLMGFSPVQLRDRRVDLSFPRLSRPKLPACSLLSMTGPAGGADAPSLTFAARAGALVERPGRGNALRGGPNQRMWASAVGWRLRTREFPLPLPTRCSACGKRKPEVDGARWVIVSGAGDHPTKR